MQNSSINIKLPWITSDYGSNENKQYSYEEDVLLHHVRKGLRHPSTDCFRPLTLHLLENNHWYFGCTETVFQRR
jgi:hypothetical protein